MTLPTRHFIFSSAIGRNTLLAFSMALSMALAGCSSTPTEPEKVFTYEEKLNTAKEVLALEVRLEEIVKVCHSMDDRSKQLATDVQQSWWSNYWSYLSAADQLYLNEIKLKQKEMGEVDGQLSALKFKMEAVEEQGRPLSSKFARTNLRFQACRLYLHPYQHHNEKLQINAKFMPVLKSILSDYPQGADSPPSPVISYQSDYEATRQNGRSYYQLEKIAKSSAYCINPVVLNLYEDWPTEVYGIYCEGSKPVSVDCSWGNCDLQSFPM